jgi:hypothetical protein
MSSNGGTNNKNKPTANPSVGAANKPKNTSTSSGTNSKTAQSGNLSSNKLSANNKNKSTANQSLSENLSELLASNANNLTGINTATPAAADAALTTTNNKSIKAPNNSAAKNKPSTANNLGNKSENSGSLFDDLFASTTAPPAAAAQLGTATANTITNPAETLVSTTESVIQSASDKLSEVKEAVSDRLGELSTGGDLWMNLLKIGITILILIALFYVAKYLFTRYQDSVYAAPMLLDGMKNGKHALVISQDPANPSYIPIPNSDNQSSLEFTYDFWILIDSYEYKKGEWKHIFHKGNSSSYPNRAPGIWLHPDTNAMRVYMNTQDNILEYVDIDNLPLRKWIHVSLVLHDMDLDVFINGYLKKRQKLTSVPKLNNGDFWVNMFGGFDGYLARIRYYAKAIGVDEIAANVRAGPGNSSCIDTGQVPPYLDDDWWLQ